MASTVIENIGLLATPTGRAARSGKEQGEIRLLQNAYLCYEDGVITAVGEGKAPMADERIDARGKLVTPGLIDPHTHLVFGGWRQHELAMKLKGVTYLEILAAGGGILSTVTKTRPRRSSARCFAWASPPASASPATGSAPRRS